MKTSTSPGGRDLGSPSSGERENSATVSGVIDTSLSSRIIRLAHSRPEFRDALQPLLYVISAVKDDSVDIHDVERREFVKLLAFGPRFGILSGSKGSDEAKNKRLRSELLGDLKTIGYRKISPLPGEWELLPSDPLLINNITPDDLFELGRKYEQEFVVYAREPGLIGFYYMQGDPRARLIVDPQGDPSFRSLTDMTPYSRAQGLDTDFGLLWSGEFPWDGRTGLTRKQIRTMLKNQGLKGSTRVADLERAADLKKKQLEKMLQGPLSFGNISAWRGELSRSENKKNMGELQKDLESRGYKVFDSSADWYDEDAKKTYFERSFLVPKAKPEDLFELGREYNQDSVIYKSPEGVLGMYDTHSGKNADGSKRPHKALLAHKEDGSPAFEIQTGKTPKKQKGPGPRHHEREQPELFSRTRGINFSFDFDWGNALSFDGKTPISAKRKEEVSAKKKPPSEEFKRQWQEFLKTKTRNPEHREGERTQEEVTQGYLLKNPQHRPSVLRDWKQLRNRSHATT